MRNLRKEAQEQLSQNEKKWSETLMRAGWTVLPSVILERQQALGLDPMDVNILLHLARYWWYSENPPHPSKRSIAECIGVDKSTVRRRIARLEKDGLISRQRRFDKKYGQQSNSYHFNGLIEAATPYAKEAIAARKQQKEETAKRRRRKRPVKPQEHEEE
jgi:predicted transcriptional regulator